MSGKCYTLNCATKSTKRCVKKLMTWMPKVYNDHWNWSSIDNIHSAVTRKRGTTLIMKHLRVLLKAEYLVDNYKDMKNFQVRTVSKWFIIVVSTYWLQAKERERRLNRFDLRPIHTPINFSFMRLRVQYNISSKF